MPKKNVLILASSHNIGGFETKLDNLIRHLDREKINLTFLLVYPDYKARHLPEEVRAKYRAFFSWDEVEVIEMRMKFRYELSLIFKAARLFRKMHIDVLYYTSIGAGTFIAPAAALMAGVERKIKEVQTIFKGQYPTVLKGLDRILTSKMDCVLVASEFLKRMLMAELHVKASKIKVLPNAIDLEKFGQVTETADLRDGLGIPRGSRIVGMIANLVAIKDHRTVMRAIPEILKVKPDTVFLLFGDGPLRSDLEALAGKLKILRNIRFMGYRTDVAKYIPLFDVGILSSRVEIHPISLIEIMASGIPVVAPRVGGIPEIVIHEETGLLISQGNAAEMAAAILALFNDRKLSDRLGRKAGERVREMFSLDRMIKQTEAILTGREIKQ